jgi:hypothetical protein
MPVLSIGKLFPCRTDSRTHNGIKAMTGSILENFESKILVFGFVSESFSESESDKKIEDPNSEEKKFGSTTLVQAYAAARDAVRYPLV